jgi:hypothetical protein
MHFGVLRVLNDDTVAADRGFSTHRHENMEIISIPLEGDLEHKDSMGNTTIIKSGDVQAMSAGTGIAHSEYNRNSDRPVKFLQIWIIPNKQDVAPRYDQVTLNLADRQDRLQQVLSPNESDEGVRIHQNAWFFMGNLTRGAGTVHTIKGTGNGVYVFVLSGDVRVDGQQLQARDGYGVWDVEGIAITADTDAEILLMDVPMEIA